jgi:hypothetical protein
MTLIRPRTAPWLLFSLGLLNVGGRGADDGRERQSPDRSVEAPDTPAQALRHNYITR